jgi:hypothetical protein
MDVCLLWVLCVVRLRSLRRADLSSRGILPSVVCLTDCDHESSTTRRPLPTGGGGLLHHVTKMIFDQHHNSINTLWFLFFVHYVSNTSLQQTVHCIRQTFTRYHHYILVS